MKKPRARDLGIPFNGTPGPLNAITDLAGLEVQAKMLNPRPVQPGEKLAFHLMLDKTHVFDAASGVALRG